MEPNGRDRRGRRTALLLALVATALPLAYAGYTSQAWEDYYISFRHSVHLAEGQGLTYQAGERIQGFSSPATTLLQAAAYRAAGSRETVALWIFRALSAGAYGAGLFLLLGALRRSGVTHGIALLVPALLYLLDVKSVAFTANGMETGLLLGLLAAALGRLADGPGGSGVPLGALWAGLLWTRPDAAVYVGAMAAAVVLLPGDRPRPWRTLWQAAGVAAGAYLPWLLFAGIYYGTPVPQSVTAKAANSGVLSAGGVLAALGRAPSVAAGLYLPPYAEFAAWPLAKLAGGLVALAASLYWLWPRGRTFPRRASLVAFVGLTYLALLPRVYPWYFPAAAVASLPAVAAILWELQAAIGSTRARRLALALTCVVGLLGLGRLGLETTRLARLTQRVSEDGNRRPLGLYLRAEADPTDRVYLECPGYIGYYAGLRMLDYPGLVAPEVVEARRLLGDDFVAVGILLAPEWMVLRTEEVGYFEAQRPGWLPANYELARTFDVSERLRREAPDQPGILYDGTFHVLRRRSRR